MRRLTYNSKVQYQQFFAPVEPIPAALPTPNTGSIWFNGVTFPMLEVYTTFGAEFTETSGASAIALVEGATPTAVDTVTINQADIWMRRGHHAPYLQHKSTYGGDYWYRNVSFEALMDESVDTLAPTNLNYYCQII